MKIASALLAAGLLSAGPVLAQTTAAPAQNTAPAGNAAPAHTPSSAQATGKPDSYTSALNERITSMHQRLHITAEQEPAWDAFAQTMRDNADAVRTDYEKRSSEFKTMNAAENLQNYAQIEQDRAQGVQKLAATFDTLYQGLSDQQKKTADAMFRQYDVNRAKARRGARPNAG